MCDDIAVNMKERAEPENAKQLNLFNELGVPDPDECACALNLFHSIDVVDDPGSR
jgi:hypothetical protein